MATGMTLSIENLPQISAIYYALLQCGYDYYSHGRSDSHIAAIRRFAGGESVSSFFSSIKQTTCEENHNHFAGAHRDFVALCLRRKGTAKSDAC